MDFVLSFQVFKKKIVNYNREWDLYLVAFMSYSLSLQL